MDTQSSPKPILQEMVYQGILNFDGQRYRLSKETASAVAEIPYGNNFLTQVWQYFEEMRQNNPSEFILEKKAFKKLQIQAQKLGLNPSLKTELSQLITMGIVEFDGQRYRLSKETASAVAEIPHWNNFLTQVWQYFEEMRQNNPSKFILEKKAFEKLQIQAQKLGLNPSLKTELSQLITMGIVEFDGQRYRLSKETASAVAEIPYGNNFLTQVWQYFEEMRQNNPSKFILEKKAFEKLQIQAQKLGLNPSLKTELSQLITMGIVEFDGQRYRLSKETASAVAEIPYGNNFLTQVWQYFEEMRQNNPSEFILEKKAFEKLQIQAQKLGLNPSLKTELSQLITMGIVEFDGQRYRLSNIARKLVVENALFRPSLKTILAYFTSQLRKQPKSLLLRENRTLKILKYEAKKAGLEEQLKILQAAIDAGLSEFQTTQPLAFSKFIPMVFGLGFLGLSIGYFLIPRTPVVESIPEPISQPSPQKRASPSPQPPLVVLRLPQPSPVVLPSPSPIQTPTPVTQPRLVPKENISIKKDDVSPKVIPKVKPQIKPQKENIVPPKNIPKPTPTPTLEPAEYPEENPNELHLY
jgi:uncharacterized short protein YbdD (DUF466 family)